MIKRPPAWTSGPKIEKTLGYFWPSCSSLTPEHSDQVFQTAAESLKRMGLGREDAENILTYEVAPVAGFNLGYLLWPVIGAWDGLDREPCAARLEGTSSAGQGGHDGIISCRTAGCGGW